MMRKRHTQRPTQRLLESVRPSAHLHLHTWVRSLPWVVERPDEGTHRGVRLFAIECEPLARRQVWLMTGMSSSVNGEGTGIAAIMPRAALRPPRPAGWVERIATPLPNGHVVVMLENGSLRPRQEVENFVLTAYMYAMA